MLGHELRNPLSPIRNAVEVLREHGKALDREQRIEYLAVISRQIDQLTRLVDDLLDVARITRGRIRLDRRPARVREALERAVETARPLFDAHGQSFLLDLPEDDVWIDADPDRLAQAVGNLLHNAAKFTPEGGAISLRAGREDGRGVVRIRDSGPGIPEEILPRVFELFTQGAQSLDRSHGGLGLGLALVRRLVEMHGGTVAARNLPGGGAELAVTLPELAAPAPEALDAPLESGDGRPGPRRILVVDDNRDSAEALSALLRLRGHTVAAAWSGPEALERAEELRPEVGILDIGLPGMDGFEVARELRERHGPDLTLVALTGYGREVGFDHYLLKPVTSAALESLLAAAPAVSGDAAPPERPREPAAE